ncbi:Asp-tRNA(Asn)/Glu-tRNA(Gln) amidotransferase subunit GatB [Ureaplasma ceti]|uniref:Aspartyl/glutamyl-tRNA(Asn/Gln) amidotransferase subunit B n=1 Tax=Ureaplasma ceti TaxID=3119530 RepID=A0ABP9U7B3_9BACT
MNNFETTIGIEVHTVLNTKTKMFSPSLNNHNLVPNTLINEIDLAQPGVMPQPNVNAVIKGILLANELHMDVNYDYIQFDRKNYFYIDLPKGFQITQQYHPIGTNGYVDINVNGQAKKVLMERIHMEEDTAKQTAKDGKIYLDYNRAGLPLIEIVTRPVMHSANEAGEYLRELIRILRFANISDAKLEDGSLRADVNISIRPYGQKEFGTKVEIKNINSVNNVIKAIEFEEKRQRELLLTGQSVQQETRRFDDATNTTVFMREKTNAVDYRYIIEPNIMAFRVTDEEYREILSKKNPSLHEVNAMLIQDQLDDKAISQLVNDYDFYKVYNHLKQQVHDPLLCFKWLSVELAGLLKKDNQWFDKLQESTLNHVARMLQLVLQQEINGKQAKTILEHIYKTNKDPETLIKELGFEQIKDKGVIREILLKHIEKNPNMVQQYYERPERGEKFFIGMVMKDTNAQANPVVTTEVLKEILSNQQ